MGQPECRRNSQQTEQGQFEKGDLIQAWVRSTGSNTGGAVGGLTGERPQPVGHGTRPDSWVARAFGAEAHRLGLTNWASDSPAGRDCGQPG